MTKQHITVPPGLYIYSSFSFCCKYFLLYLSPDARLAAARKQQNVIIVHTAPIVGLLAQHENIVAASPKTVTATSLIKKIEYFITINLKMQGEVQHPANCLVVLC